MAQGVESCVQIVNTNLLMYKGLAKINQHMPFHFNMILSPQDHANEWKIVLQQMLDFI